MVNAAAKSASTLGQTAGAGAGAGAAAGALVTLFSEKPSVRELVKNVLVGGAGGAVIGGGVHALGGEGDTKPAPPPGAAAASTPSSAPRKMDLGVAALSGAFPLGIGAAIHGGVSQGPAQAVGSGTAALAPSLLVGMIQLMRRKDPSWGSLGAATASSMLGSMGAAHAGNKLREN